MSAVLTGSVTPSLSLAILRLNQFTSLVRSSRRFGKCAVALGGVKVVSKGSRLRSGAFSCVFQDFLKWRDPDSNRGHHGFQTYSEALRYAENPHRLADLCPQRTVAYHLVLSLLLSYC